jgi:UPF0716 protein FxsA
MKNIFLALFVLFILELIVLIQVGSALGALTTITIMFVAMVIGSFLVKMRFAQIVNQIREQQRLDLSIFWIPLAGFLFIFPGFISDILALLLLLPPLQNFIGKSYAHKHPNNFSYHESYYSYTQKPDEPQKQGRVIDGKVEKDDSES